MKRKITMLCGIVLFMLFSTSLTAQIRSAKTNMLISTSPTENTEKSLASIVDKHVSSGVTVTTLISQYLFPYDVSQSGEYVAISDFGTETGYFWSEATGLIAIEGSIYCVSEDGMIGGTYFDGSLGANVAGLWSSSTQEWTFLGMNPAYPQISLEDYTSLWGMNTTGSICVGMQWTADWMTLPFKWTAGVGYEMLSIPAGTYVGRPEALSDDGSIIGGHIDWMPALWVEGEYTMISESTGEVLSVSPDGEYATGYSDTDGFIWERTSGEITFFSNDLGTGDLTPTCVTNDGTVFGYACLGWPPMPDARTAFARTNDGTVMSFNDYAEARGMEDAQSWSFYSINSVSADGRFAIGAAIDPTGAEVSFIIDFADEPETCDAPTDLTATLENDNNIVLNWTAVEGAVEYIVSRDGENIAAVTTNTYTDEAMAIGDYCYKVATACDNGITSDYSNEACQTVILGISNMSNSIKVFPNPANEQFTITSSEIINSVVIFNCIGKKIAEYKVNNTTFNHNLSGMTAGIYSIKVSTSTSDKNFKLVVE
ncbi:MAG: T9SS type A sorting domain-containing protein [Bacteroidales bacterium]|nr:T9SS type A sorting domain-containing protein [Bacteroidales bacterium]MDD2204738.1 T9SS type A sorting domain-containing protein [Bacteroidales bacterium]MDD3914161.1 T9SS type A sorting domain-containing protein [Bacteroidales bacterium]MDD4633696.1 T9SS type A sorting domain-containing protein [Bacteroidales bacterium]